MLFSDFSTALIQFRLPGRNDVPEGIRYLGEETADGRGERLERYERMGPMDPVLERNGAFVAESYNRLATAGFLLVDAFAQTRDSLKSDWKNSKPYTLVTFVFDRDRPLARSRVIDAFGAFGRSRYEYVSVKRSVARDRPLICLICKTIAKPAVELKDIEDGEAAAFGIAVSKAVRKEDRLQQANLPEAGVKAAPNDVAPSVENSADPQLDRLKAAGWQVDEAKRPEGGKIFLFRINSAGRRGELVHDCRKAMKAGSPHRMRA